jgi:hypothetical protein
MAEKVACKSCNYLVLRSSRVCFNCGEPIPKYAPGESPLEKALTKALGIIALIVVFGGCVYQAGYPWNCQQAKEAHSNAYSARVNKELEDAGLNYLNNLKKAADDMYAKCSN